MDINSFEILLTGMLVSALSLMLFIYLGNLILDLLKIPAPQLTPLKRQISNSGKVRRRIESKPGIICSLPIHQESRQDAPLF
jgi:hypothetical protein